MLGKWQRNLHRIAGQQSLITQRLNAGQKHHFASAAILNLDDVALKTNSLGSPDRQHHPIRHTT